MGNDWQHGTSRGSSDRAPLAAGLRQGFKFPSEPGSLVGKRRMAQGTSWGTEVLGCS